EPEHATEDRGIQIQAPRLRATLVVIQTRARRAPVKEPGGAADEHERDVGGRFGMRMLVQPEELAADHAERAREPDRRHRETDGADEMSAGSAGRSGAGESRLARG